MLHVEVPALMPLAADEIDHVRMLGSVGRAVTGVALQTLAAIPSVARGAPVVSVDDASSNHAVRTAFGRDTRSKQLLS